MTYYLPIILIVAANTLYQICAKETPANIDPLASLVVTYLVAAAASAVMYFLLHKKADLLTEFSRLNWAPFVLGLVVVALEAGYIYAFKLGWQVNSAQLVQSAALAVLLLFVGNLLYREAITMNKLLGVVICLVGLYFLNK